MGEVKERIKYHAKFIGSKALAALEKVSFGKLKMIISEKRSIAEMDTSIRWGYMEIDRKYAETFKNLEQRERDIWLGKGEFHGISKEERNKLLRECEKHRQMYIEQQREEHRDFEAEWAPKVKEHEEILGILKSGHTRPVITGFNRNYCEFKNKTNDPNKTTDQINTPSSGAPAPSPYAHQNYGAPAPGTQAPTPGGRPAPTMGKQAPISGSRPDPASGNPAQGGNTAPKADKDKDASKGTPHSASAGDTRTDEQKKAEEKYKKEYRNLIKLQKEYEAYEKSAKYQEALDTIKLYEGKRYIETLKNEIDRFQNQVNELEVKDSKAKEMMSCLTSYETMKNKEKELEELEANKPSKPTDDERIAYERKVADCKKEIRDNKQFLVDHKMMDEKGPEEDAITKMREEYQKMQKDNEVFPPFQEDMSIEQMKEAMETGLKVIQERHTNAVISLESKKDYCTVCEQLYGKASIDEKTYQEALRTRQNLKTMNSKLRDQTRATELATADVNPKDEARLKQEVETEMKVEAEAKAKAEAEAKAKAEAETKAKAEAESKAKAEAEAKAKDPASAVKDLTEQVRAILNIKLQEGVLTQEQVNDVNRTFEALAREAVEATIGNKPAPDPGPSQSPSR